MPRTKRPPHSSCTVAATVASAAGWRVNALVTPVAKRRTSVLRAASAMATNGSPTRFWESTNVIPSHPASWASSAWNGADPGSGSPIVQSCRLIAGAYGRGRTTAAACVRRSRLRLRRIRRWRNRSRRATAARPPVPPKALPARSNAAGPGATGASAGSNGRRRPVRSIPGAALLTAHSTARRPASPTARERALPSLQARLRARRGQRVGHHDVAVGVPEHLEGGGERSPVAGGDRPVPAVVVHELAPAPEDRGQHGRRRLTTTHRHRHDELPDLEPVEPDRPGLGRPSHLGLEVLPPGPIGERGQDLDVTLDQGPLLHREVLHKVVRDRACVGRVHLARQATRGDAHAGHGV